MQIYKAPLKDIKFILNNFLNLSDNKSILSKLDFDISDLEMVIEEAAKICEETLLPLNQIGDSEGCNDKHSTSITYNIGLEELILRRQRCHNNNNAYLNSFKSSFI